MINVSVDIKPIMAAYKALPKAIRDEMLDKAVKAGAQLVQKDAKRRIPNGPTGNLRKSLKVKRQVARNPLLSVYAVTFSQKGSDKGFHAHLIERGHYIWRRKKRGKGSASGGKRYEMENTGKRTKATPMLSPAFFSNRAKVIRVIGGKLSVTNMERLILSKLRSRARVLTKR